MAGSEQMVNMRTPYHMAIKETKLPKASARQIAKRWNDYIRYCPMTEVKNGKYLRDELNGMFFLSLGIAITCINLLVMWGVLPNGR